MYKKKKTLEMEKRNSTILTKIRKKKNENNKYFYIMTPLSVDEKYRENTGYLSCNLAALFFSILDPNQIFRKYPFLPLTSAFRITIHKIDETLFIDSTKRIEMYIQRLKGKNNVRDCDTPLHFTETSDVYPFDPRFVPENLPSNALEIWDELHRLCDEHCTSHHSFCQMFYFLEGLVIFYDKRMLTLTQLIDLILKNEDKKSVFEFNFIPKIKREKKKRRIKNRHF